MSSLAFGITMLVVGMGGTLLTLWLLALVIRGLTAVLPARDATAAAREDEDSRHG
jgi:Na+-transporting methylmalonyl-CoA/oxaloacetate decarboxylase gamma subunit